VIGQIVAAACCGPVGRDHVENDFDTQPVGLDNVWDLGAATYGSCGDSQCQPPDVGRQERDGVQKAHYQADHA